MTTRRRSVWLAVVGLPLLVACATAPERGVATDPWQQWIHVLPDAPAEVTIPYQRRAWLHWIDANGDCRDTRAEVLLRDAVGPVTMDARGCRVISGQWRDPYSGNTHHTARELDIDHVVPLAAAHMAGGATWTTDRRRAFANDLEYPWSLKAVAARLNRQKGAAAPQDWMPPDPAIHCVYLEAWVTIKARWGLGLQPDERQFLLERSQTCPRTEPGASSRSTTSSYSTNMTRID